MTKEEIKKYIKDNLTIEIENKCNSYYSSKERDISVTIKFDGEVVDSSSFYITEGKSSSSY